MAQQTVHSAFIVFLDHEGKDTTTEFNISAAAFTAYNTNPAAAGLVRDVFDSIDSLSLGFKMSEGVTKRTGFFPQVLPTGDADLRQSKIVLNLQDEVNGRMGTLSIGVRDPAGYNLYPRSRNIILTEADGGHAATELLVTKVEAGVLSISGNAVTVTEAKAESFNI